MKIYPTIPLNFWIETKKTCSSQEQLLLLYLINNPHMSRLGCFRLPLNFIAQDLNWTNALLKSTFNKLINADYLIWHNHEEWGFLTNFLDWFPIRHYYQAREIEQVFNTLPENCYLSQILIMQLLEAPYLDRSFRRRLRCLLKKLSLSQATLKDVPFDEILMTPPFEGKKGGFCKL